MLLDEYTMVLYNPIKMQSTKCYWDVGMSAGRYWLKKIHWQLQSLTPKRSQGLTEQNV